MRRIILTLVLAASLCLTTAGAAHADPVSVIAAVLVTALGEGAAIAVATFIVNTAIYAATSLGITAVTSALSGKNKAGIAERQASVTSLSLGELPRELLVGEVCTAGTLVDVFNYGGKYSTDWVTRCVAVADHAIDSIVGYYVDDQFYPWTIDGIQPGFSDKLSIRFYNATVDGHAPQAHVLAAGAGWTNADRLAGISVFWIDTRYDDKVWSQGHPQIKFVLRGIRAYDMRFDPAFGYAGPSPQTWDNRASHTYTRNAAVLRYAFTRGIFAEGHHGDPAYLLIGRGLTPEEAPPERIIAAANLCDEVVNGQARYTANGVIRAADDFIAVEEMFAAAMAGQIVQREGGVEIEPGQAKAAVVTITDGSLVPGEPVSFSAFLPDTDGGRINTVVPRYVSPAQNWKDHAGPVRRDPAHIIADGGPREITLPLVLVTSADQADRCAEITRLLARLERRASVVLPPEYATLEEGDWIAWQSDRHHGGATVRYRIESWSLDEKWRQHLSLREIASSVFGTPDPIEDTAKVPPPPVPIDALGLEGVSAEAVTLPGELSTLPAIRFKWDVPVDAAVSAIRAEVRIVGETDAAPTRTEEVSAGVMVVTNGVAAGAAMETRLIPIGDPSRPVQASPWFTISTVELVAGALSEGSSAWSQIRDLIAATPPGDGVDQEALAAAVAAAEQRAAQALVAAEGRLNAADTALSTLIDGLGLTDIDGFVEYRTTVQSMIDGKASNAVVGVLQTQTDGLLSRILTAETTLVDLPNRYVSTSSFTLLQAQANNLSGRLLSAETAIADFPNQYASSGALFSLSSEVTGARGGAANLSARLLSDRQAVVDGLAGKASVSDFNSLSASVSGQGLVVSGLASRLTTVETTLDGKATTTDLTLLSNTVSGQGVTISGALTRIGTVETNLAGKASVTDLTNLTNTVAGQGVSITGALTRIGTVETDLTGRALTSDLTALGNTVSGQGLTISGALTRLGTVETSLTGKVSVSDYNSLSATVTSQGTTISGALTRIGTVEASVAGKVSVSDFNSLSAVVGGYSASITSAAQVAAAANGTANAIIGVVLDVNGRASGFVSQNNGVTASFDVRADKFSVTSPSGGARTEFSDGNWRIYDGGNVLRVRLGIW